MKPPSPRPDPFEALLAAQPHRPPAPEWRDEIIAAATQAGRSPARSRRRMIPPLRLRHAWTSLAAVWAVLALLHFDTPPAPVYAGKEPRPSRQDLERLLARQQAEIASLLTMISPRPVTAAAVNRARLDSAPHALPFAPSPAQVP